MASAQLGAAVRVQLGDALHALDTADLNLADAVVRGDAAINRARYELEDQVASELGRGGVDPQRRRLLLAVLSVGNDLERIGDHCEGIAKVALMIGDDSAFPPPPSLGHLGELVIAMLDRGMAAFDARDEAEARLTCADDDAVDELYDVLYAELIAAMTDDRSLIVPCTYLL